MEGFLTVTIIVLIFSNIFSAIGTTFNTKNGIFLYQKIARLENVKLIGKILLIIIAIPFTIVGQILIGIVYVLMALCYVIWYGFVMLFSIDKEKAKKKFFEE